VKKLFSAGVVYSISGEKDKELINGLGGFLNLVQPVGVSRAGHGVASDRQRTECEK
jgi:hypothetical protein